MTKENQRDLKRAQDIAKTAMGMIGEYIKPGVTDVDIHDFAGRVMTELGSGPWWTHGDPALVLVGERTSYSAAFDPEAPVRVYTVAEGDVVSVDVAPTYNGVWGDFARTFFVENGRASLEPTRPADREAIDLERELHRRMLEAVDETTTFEDVWRLTWDWLRQAGYENCDYHDNFGHTIEEHPSERVTFAKGVTQVIARHGRPFTYEPHIRKRGGEIGYKFEDMYSFGEKGLVKV